MAPAVFATFNQPEAKRRDHGWIRVARRGGTRRNHKESCAQCRLVAEGERAPQCAKLFQRRCISPEPRSRDAPNEAASLQRSRATPGIGFEVLTSESTYGSIAQFPWKSGQWR